MKRKKVNFSRIAGDALRHADTIVKRWLPDGQRNGNEWVARNPTRADHRSGSFKINILTGRWGDFSTGDRGGDLIALAAYLFKINQVEAATRVAEMLGVDLRG